MDIYLCLFIASFAGLALLAFAGIGRFHHSAGSGHHFTPSHSHAGSHANGARVPVKSGNNEAASWLTLVSPLVLLGLLFGFAATGLIVAPWLGHGLLRFLVALAGGLVFNFLLLQPLWRFLLGFASRPARTLDSASFEEARAVTNFDAAGNGLVRLEIDGQVQQILGSLIAEEKGRRVLAGSSLFVRSIDPIRQRCVVSCSAETNTPSNSSSRS
jgi:hypothetical protein